MANQNQQQLLVDTDAYCKLGVADLLADAVSVLGFSIWECGRLAALPYMLRRGVLRRKFGDDTCDKMMHMAEEMPVASQPSDFWLNPLVAVPSIDPGEAHLLATSAERGLLILTGDKRGLRGVKDIPGYADALGGRVIVLEAILTELCVQLGTNEIRTRIRPLMDVDVAIRLCFSDSNPSPQAGLQSYYQDLVNSIKPLNLWKPSPQARQ